MEQFDAEKAKRVWQRVRGTEEEAQPEMSLQALAVEEKRSAARYLMLSRLMQGRSKMLLRQLAEQSRSHAACLNGMSLMEGGKVLSTRINPPVDEMPLVALRKCYAHTLQSASAYAQRQHDEEYGHVFSRLSRQAREQGMAILEILGSLER